MTRALPTAPVAAIDLGTNTALLLVARLDVHAELEVLDDRCETPRLGSGVAASGILDPTAVERALHVLAGYIARAQELGVAREHMRALGTAVLRRARDGREFAETVRRKLGLVLEIASEADEARLGALSVVGAGVSPSAIVIDVGGGSFELACMALDLRVSIPIGAVVLTETWLGAQPLQPGGWPALKRAVRAAVQQLPADLAREPGREVWALGGTAINLACLANGFPKFDVLAAEGRTVHAREAERFAEQLANIDDAARRAFPIEAQRAEILPAGLALLAAILQRIGAERIAVTGRGLRYGIARELLERLSVSG